MTLNTPNEFKDGQVIPAGENALFDQICTLVEIKANANPMTTVEIARFALQLHEVMTGDVNTLTAQAEPQKPEWKGLRAPNDPFCDPAEAVTDEYIVCLEDGEQFTMMKRHLKEKYSMTPQEYKDKWKLDKDYPLTAPAYSRQKSAAAKKAKLGSYDRNKTGQKDKIAA